MKRLTISISISLLFVLSGCVCDVVTYQPIVLECNDVREPIIAKEKPAQEQEEQTEEIAEPVQVEEQIEEVYEETYEEVWIEPIYEEVYAPEIITVGQTANSDSDLRSAGVMFDDDGNRYTWYSENVLPGTGLTELNNNGRTVNDEGYVTDGEGYLAVASGSHEIGEVVETPFGTAKVYDYCETPGTIDMYTSW